MHCDVRSGFTVCGGPTSCPTMPSLSSSKSISVQSWCALVAFVEIILAQVPVYGGFVVLQEKHYELML